MKYKKQRPVNQHIVEIALELNPALNLALLSELFFGKLINSSEVQLSKL